MSDVNLTEWHVKQLLAKLHTAIQTLEKYSLNAQVAHWQRNAVERTVVFILSDVKSDLAQTIAGKPDQNGDIPF